MEGKISRINNTTDLVIDRISSLPGFILGHILSFLPTKEAVATSILSKRWNFAWVTVHNLDFDHDAERARHTAENTIFVAQNMKFVRFVDRVLLLHDYGSLNKFSLEWHWGTISSHVSSWIKTAITRNVRELHLSLGGDGEGLRIPVSGFNCDSLQSLELYGNIYFSTAAMVCLPRLECMKLHAVIFTSKEACEKLISGCPKLHYLYLSIYFDEDFTYVITSASLRRLEIYFNCRSRLKLSASSLEYLSLNGLVSGIFVEKSLSSLVQAVIRIDLGKNDILNNSIVEAVRAFDRAKFLTLSADVMRALGRATISLSTKFKRLVELEVKNFCSSLQDLIQSSCNLEALRIFQVPRLGTSDPHDLSTWNALVEVPRCLSNSLKKVYFGGYKGLEDEREMIRYMLEHGSALEVMQISCYIKGDGEKIELLQEVCEFPRKSPVCKVQFSVWPTKREFKPLL